MAVGSSGGRDRMKNRRSMCDDHKARAVVGLLDTSAQNARPDSDRPKYMEFKKEKYNGECCVVWRSTVVHAVADIRDIGQFWSR